MQHKLLIAPQGIEISKAKVHLSPWRLLIAPQGIEMAFNCVVLFGYHFLLIAPQGIEIYDNISLSFSGGNF